MTMRELNERDILKICYLYYQEEKTQEEHLSFFRKLLTVHISEFDRHINPDLAD